MLLLINYVPEHIRIHYLIKLQFQMLLDSIMFNVIMKIIVCYLELNFISLFYSYLDHQLNHETDNIKFERISPCLNQSRHHLQVSNSQFQLQSYDDLSNKNYIVYPTTQTLPISQQSIVSTSTTGNIYTIASSNYSNNSNILMVPPNPHSCVGGSLPDLRSSSAQQQVTVPSTATFTTEQVNGSFPSQQNNVGNLVTLV